MIPTNTIESLCHIISACYPQAQVVDQLGFKLFVQDKKQLIGISVDDGRYSLLVPQSEIIDKYLPRLGQVRAGAGCVYFAHIADLNIEVLEEMLDDIRLRLM